MTKELYFATNDSMRLRITRIYFSNSKTLNIFKAKHFLSFDQLFPQDLITKSKVCRIFYKHLF